MTENLYPTTWIFEVTDSAPRLIASWPAELKRSADLDAALREAVTRACSTRTRQYVEIDGDTDGERVAVTATPTIGPPGDSPGDSPNGSSDMISHVVCTVTPRRPHHTASDLDSAVLLTDAAPLGMVRTDANGLVIYANAKFREIIGLSGDEALGDVWNRVGVHPDDVELMMTRSAETIGRGRDFFGRFRLLRPDGEVIWVHARARQIWDEDGNFGGLVGSMADVTEQITAEANQQRLAVALEATTDIVAIAAAQGELVYANRAARKILGVGENADISEIHIDEFETESAQALVAETILPTLEAEGTWQGEITLKTRTGREIPLSLVSIAHRDASGNIDYVSHVGRDVTEQRRFEAELENRAAQREVVVELGQSALGDEDLSVLMDNVVRSIASTLAVSDCHILEYVSETADFLTSSGVGRLFDGVRAADSPVADVAERSLTLGSDVADDGQSAAVVIGEPDNPWGILLVHGAQREHEFMSYDMQFLKAIAHVIASAIGRQRDRGELVHQALHDSLTGLPNRTLMLDRLDHALARAGRKRETENSVAVAFLDLDHFKVVNDSLGHASGDELLVSIAKRLTAAVRPGDTVARFGGDEFVIICEDIDRDEDLDEFACRIIDEVSQPLMLGDREVIQTASIGIARAGAPMDTPEHLVANADAAMYRAKERGRARHELFDEAMRSRSITRLENVTAMRRALERDELRVYYQPIVSLATGDPIGMEALLRWIHPVRGLVYPEEFIPDAEDTGMIRTYGAWVLDHACKQAATWDEMFPQERMYIAVNLSARQLTDPHLVDTVRGALGDSGLEPNRLSLEITESVLMDDAELSLETLRTLRDIGVGLAVDDFGTGYSSLSYLRQLPVDALKIDRSFVDGLGSEAEDSAIVEAIISMARALGLGVVAEGVETTDQLTELRRLGCTAAQGHLFSEAQPPASLAEQLDIGIGFGRPTVTPG